MGKIRTRVIGDTEVEEKQKKDQKERSKMKKTASQKEEEAEITILDTDKDLSSVKEAVKEKKKKKDIESVQPKSSKRGKKYLSAKDKIDRKKIYDLREAIDLLKSISFVGFEESVEIHLNLDKSGMKGEVEFPHSTGKTVKVQIVDDKVLEAIEKGVIDFDILISHPSYMPKLTKFAKILGPRGLMPNPKAGTISTDPQSVAKKFSGGTMKWKGEPKFPLAHQIIAKLSHPQKNIAENAETYLRAVGKASIHKAFIKSTMSPAITIDLSFLG